MTRTLRPPHLLILLPVLLLCAPLACTSGSDQAGTATATSLDLGAPVDMSSPTLAGSNTPHLAVTADRTLLLSWTQRGADSTTSIRMAAWKDSTWDSTRTIATARPFFVNWADFPVITALGNGDVAAHWLEREGGSKYAYGIRVVRSKDQGRTWGAAVTPHTDGLAAEHGFVSMWAEGADRIGLVWLDGRKSAMADSAREMTIRSAAIAPDGTLERESLIDARSCDCCQTGTAPTRGGRVIAYRDRTAEEIRDIVVVRATTTGWTEPQKVHDDDWHYPGCPVNGPQVASLGDTVAVAWYTAAHDTARVYVARSLDGGATFGAPVRVDEGNPIGRVDVLLDDQARPVVVWLEQRSPEQADVLVRRVGPDGTRGVPQIIASTSGARQSGFPRIARHGDALIAAYTTVTPTMTVRIARVPLSPASKP
ncbi:sialidase family protein [Gemmatimonas aurantiaca]|uniref:sialidase family protein n=1 Tax=Gemmatimonas aurantiaca TaxID=173480 RepID=UPI00301E06CD